MISCTEFIPAYSELFWFLDENYGGHKEVERFWEYLFKPDGKGIPLINYAKKEGLVGCWKYWKETLTEEAADVTRYMNEKAGWIHSHCHHCPSKGRLLEYEKTIGLKPYYDYCGHCDYYRASLEEVGLTWIRNHIDVDQASCRSVIYDPKIFKGVMVMDENVVKLEIRSKDHEYFHPGFHSSMDRGLFYILDHYGKNALKAYFHRFVKNVYWPVLEEMKQDPLGAIERKIRSTYESEKALDVLSLENDGKVLSVRVSFCPAVKYLRDKGLEVHPSFRYSTEYVMEALSEMAGLSFSMDSYDDETGAASYRLIK